MVNDIMMEIFVIQNLVIFYLWNVLWVLPDILRKPNLSHLSKFFWSILVIGIPNLGILIYYSYQQFDWMAKGLSNVSYKKRADVRIVILAILLVPLVLVKTQRYKILGIYLVFFLYVIGVLIFIPNILKEKKLELKDKIFWVVNVFGGGFLGVFLYHFVFRAVLLWRGDKRE